MDRIERLKEFLQATPGDSFLKHALALEYVKIGEEDNAKRLFEEILKQEPEYVGSYYHLGKLLERKNEISLALSVYEKGMVVAKNINDRHAYSELSSAYEELVD
ncbi:MAG TPA: hypothetical protein VIU45_00170 [Chitinophagaceae bacterium]